MTDNTGNVVPFKDYFELGKPLDFKSRQEAVKYVNELEDKIKEILDGAKALTEEAEDKIKQAQGMHAEARTVRQLQRFWLETLVYKDK